MAYIELFEKLASNNSRLFKEELLREHAHDETLKRIFFMGLDPFTNYWIRAIPEYTPGGVVWLSDNRLDIEDAMSGLMLLSDRAHTGHSGIAHLKGILETIYPAEDSKVIEMIIAGDFKCGVSGSTVNKIWPGLIKEFPVMLATANDQKLIDKLQWPVCINTKFDGMRANAVVKDGKVTFYSRNGKVLDLLGNMEEEFLDMAKGRDIVYDGELVAYDSSGNLLPRKQSNGIASKANKGTISEAEAKMLHIVLWDRILYDAWSTGFDSTQYAIRADLLEDDRADSLGEKVHIAEWQEASNLEEVQEIFQQHLARGEEGIIVKNMVMPWENKRSKQQLKFKAERSADLLCTGVQEGSGKYAGMIGALKLTTSDGKIECSCGSGLTDADRKKAPSEYLGKIIEIVFNEKIQSKGDKVMSLFLPIFQGVRFDKSVANSSTEI